MQKVTLKQIAAHSGVSISTVSKVINGNDTRSASPETAEKILASARELGYRTGAGNPCSYSNRVGVVLCSYIADKYTHTYYSKLYRCLEEELHKHDCVIDFYYTLPEILNSAVIKNEILSSDAEALILIDGFAEFPVPEIKAHFRYLLDISLQEIDNASNDTIIMEIYQATRRIINQLIEAGRTHIFFTSGDESIGLLGPVARPGSNSYYDARTRAYVDELAAHGLPIEEKLFHMSEQWSSISAYSQLRKLLRGGERIDAIFAADDSLSIACYKALIDCGVRIPEEIALVGFDDVPDNFLADHKISSLSVPKEEIAQTAVELLLARMQGCFSRPLKVSVPVSFISRDTF